MLLVGIIVGFIAMAFLSFSPIVGPILAGFIGGIIAGGGARRGLKNKNDFYSTQLQEG